MVIYCENCGDLSLWISTSNIRLEDKRCTKCQGKVKTANYDSQKQQYFAGPLKKTEKSENFR